MATIDPNGILEWPIRYRKDPGTVFKHPEDREMFEGSAIGFLWNWTGQQFGTISEKVRPCRAETAHRRSTFLRFYTAAGDLRRPGCGECGDQCGCTRLRSVKLPGPIAEVTKITVNGTELTEDEYGHDRYRVYNYSDTPWPARQDILAGPTEDNTFEIEYKRGVPVPIGGQVAAGLLAIEFFKGANNDPSCALPQRLTSLTRQGVSMDIMDGFEDIEKGTTGIWMVDSWVQSVTKPRTPSRVYSPDIPRKVAP